MGPSVRDVGGVRGVGVVLGVGVGLGGAVGAGVGDGFCVALGDGVCFGRAGGHRRFVGFGFPEIDVPGMVRFLQSR